MPPSSESSTAEELVRFTFHILFNSEDGGNTILQNVGKYLLDDLS